MREHIINYLKDKHGDDGTDWFYEGCPQTVLTRCADLRFKTTKSGDKPREDYTYMNFIDYHSIIFFKDNFEDLKTIFTPPNLEKVNKDIKLKWLKDYEKIRNKWSHQDESEQVVDKKDYETLNEIYNWLDSRLRISN